MNKEKLEKIIRETILHHVNRDLGVEHLQEREMLIKELLEKIDRSKFKGFPGFEY